MGLEMVIIWDDKSQRRAGASLTPKGWHIVTPSPRCILFGVQNQVNVSFGVDVISVVEMKDTVKTSKAYGVGSLGSACKRCILIDVSDLI